jgi:O-antigen/teichoic acid export membrane protein
LYAAYAKFFQHGEKGIHGSFKFSVKLLPLGVGYGLLCGTTIYFVAPVMPLILGSDFDKSVEAVRWLAIIPLLKTFHYFAADALTGAGYQGFRSLVQIVVAMISIILNVWMIPILGWKGAAISAICSNSILAVMLWIGSLYLNYKIENKAHVYEVSKYT